MKAYDRWYFTLFSFTAQFYISVRLKRLYMSRLQVHTTAQHNVT